jgi:hypothetical protein
MQTVKLMSKRIFTNRNILTQLILLAFYFTIVTGYASESVDFTAVNEITRSLDSISVRNPSRKFIKKFNSLVSRAYFKLLVEAERADIRLVDEYKRLYAKNEDNLNDLAIQKEFTMVYRRFLTHRRMLSGLKSWRIFSENRTGDLEYFKKEYRNTVYTMHLQKASDDKMISFLMHRLADLYHLPQ